jgi:hypothetical protein
MIFNYELERALKVIVFPKAPFQHSPGRAKENHARPLEG